MTSSTAPLLEVITLLSDAASVAQWIPLARLKARQLHELSLLSKRLHLLDGTEIGVRIDPPFAYITLRGGFSGAYQFVGSLDWLYKTYRDPSFPTGIDRMLPLGYATLVTLKGITPHATPLVSSAEASLQNAWRYTADPTQTDHYLQMTPAHQWDGMGVLQWYGPTADVPRRNVPHLITGWQQAHPCEGLGWYGSGSGSRFVTLDMAYDFGPTLFSSNPLVGSNKSPDSDWYGQAAWRTVDSPLGSRTFIIMVDVNSVFYCYPTEGYGDTILFGTYTGQKGNVPAALTQSQTCPWPAWVTHEDLGMLAVNASVPTTTHKARLRPLWTFNHAGTRAACITARRAANWNDAYFNSEFYDDTGTLQTTYREDYPGLVEVAFEISITGTLLSQFTFTVTLAQELYCETDHRAPVAVGYALRPMSSPLEVEIPLDTLLLLEYNHYIDNPALAKGPPTPHGAVNVYDLHRPNKATVAVVSAQIDGYWTRVRGWLAYYACYPPLGDDRLFHPQIQEFQAFAGQTGYANHFRYIANLCALDMNSLSFCIGANVFTLGDIQTGTSTWQTYGATAATVLTIAFNQESDRQSIGHPELKGIVEAMLDLDKSYPREFGTLYPDFTQMTEFDCGATLDYAWYDPSAWESDPIIKATRYATLTVHNGLGSSWSTLIQGASEDLTLYSNIPAVSLFSGYSHIYGPQVFTYWDGLPNVRPGIRWAVGGTLQAGTLSFSNYPYGVIHHNSVLFLTTAALNNVGARFSVHRNGSWALFMGPVAARTDLSAWWENGVLLTPPALAYEQTLVDKIVFRNETQNAEITTTHLAMLNQAFGKTLTPEDFHFNLRYATTTGAEFQPASDDPSVPSWYPVTRSTPLGIIWTHQYFYLNRWYNEFCFDPNFVVQKLHYTYNSFTTFPTPRQEGVFLPP